MKRWTRAIFHNWHIKLTCLGAATLIWLFIKHNVSEDSGRDAGPGQIMPTE